MQKVKVQRYISGKKPDYAQGVSSSEESDSEDFIEQQRPERRQQMLPQIISHKEDQSDDEKEVRLYYLLYLTVLPASVSHYIWFLSCVEIVSADLIVDLSTCCLLYPLVILHAYMYINTI